MYTEQCTDDLTYQITHILHPITVIITKGAMPQSTHESMRLKVKFLFADLPVWDHECPGVSHLKLKRLIQKIMAEAMRLPDLFNQSGVAPPRPEEQMPFFDPKKYEQLVATAVLNKVRQ